METKTKTQEIVGNSEDLATTAPPAKVELPKLSPKQTKAQDKPLSILSKLASGISQIRIKQPRPKRPKRTKRYRAPRVHHRPRRSFD